MSLSAASTRAARRSRSRWKIGRKTIESTTAPRSGKKGAMSVSSQVTVVVAVRGLGQADVAAARHEALVPDREMGGSLERRDLHGVLERDPEDLDPTDAPRSDADGPGVVRRTLFRSCIHSAVARCRRGSPRRARSARRPSPRPDRPRAIARPGARRASDRRPMRRAPPGSRAGRAGQPAFPDSSGLRSPPRARASPRRPSASSARSPSPARGRPRRSRPAGPRGVPSRPASRAVALTQ